MYHLIGGMPITSHVPLFRLHEQVPICGVWHELWLQLLHKLIPIMEGLARRKNTTKGVSNRHDGVLDGNGIREITLLLAGWAFQKPWQEMIRPPSECVELRIFLAEFPESIRAGPIAALPSFAASSQPGLG